MSFAAARYLRRPSPVRLRPPTPAPPQPPAVHPILQSLTPLPPLPTAQLTAPPAACAPSLTCADRRCSRCLRRPPPAHMGVEVTEVWLAASVFLNLKAEQTLVFSSHLLATIFPPTNPATCVAALNVDVVKFTQYNPALDFSATFACRLRVKDVTSPASLLRSATLRVVDVAQPASPPPRFRRPVQPPPRARSFSTCRFTALRTRARAHFWQHGRCASVSRRCVWFAAARGGALEDMGTHRVLRPTLSYLNALYST
ncbi:hypothetical protein GGX14DRAFT_553866 [Mycena pura]|uniref:Uncharacterized protein n=1 Tax=Mycena pura TaxID=153505 RepID=A0AAD6YV40_9AGAR|nr:hypothetical protein GGX14DRAFT_553866 [Mycena pura]